ncbi:MAG: hypothetical protein PHP14_02985 [Candidatus Pacebacteria bacterium]|nr:hypothetical protein [Candidatus Paceibacterota bacterium]
MSSAYGCAYRTGSDDKTCTGPNSYLLKENQGLGNNSCSFTDCSGPEDKTAKVNCSFVGFPSLDPTDSGSP